MYCQKCGKKLPDDSLFCTGCGCNIAAKDEYAVNYASFENQPTIPVFEQEQVPVPVYASSPAAVPKSVEKQDKKTVVFLVLLIVSLIACVGLLVITLNLQVKNSEYKRRFESSEETIGQLERENNAKGAEINDLKKELDSVNDELAAAIKDRDEYEETAYLFMDIVDIIGSNDSWGYSTENFHANKGIMFIDRMSGVQELKIFSSYYTDFYFSVLDDSVISAKWTDEEWVGTETQIYITPVDYGITTITISNDLYDNAFEVLIIVY